MNKWVYVGVILVIIVIGAAALTYTGTYTGSQPSASTTVAPTTVATTAAVTVATTSAAAPTTANATLSPCTGYPGYVCPPTTCTPTINAFTCSNATYLYSPSNSVSDLYISLGQNTGQEWSSFGVGYAPLGTTFAGGVPQITWYTANYSSASNVGASLQSGQVVTVKPDNAETGNGLNVSTKGTVWVCFVNSGLVYVGSTCQPNGGGSAVATYVQIGALATT